MSRNIRDAVIILIGLILTAIAYHCSVPSLVEYQITGPLCDSMTSNWFCHLQLCKIYSVAVTPVKILTLGFTVLIGLCVARLIVNKGWAY